MNNQRLNIIIGNRAERTPRLMKELEEQSITNYMLWDGIHLPSIKESINLAHKQIIRYAKLAEFDEVIIAEDDVKFTHPNSWKFFLENKPKDFDIYLSMIYTGDIDDNNKLNWFTGMTLYIVKEKFYDTFLSVPDSEHIDRALAYLGNYIMCNPYIAEQYDGISSNSGQNEKYGHLLEGKIRYIGQ